MLRVISDVLVDDELSEEELDECINMVNYHINKDETINVICAITELRNERSHAQN